MNTAGSIISNLFDEQFLKKAQGYSKLFESWKELAEKNGIAAAADHSRIKDLDRGILLVEMDHPGWKQIIQTKQSQLLNDFRTRFPQLDISGISLMLGKNEPQPEETETEETPSPSPSPSAPLRLCENSSPSSSSAPSEPPCLRVNSSSTPTGIAAIEDEEFKEKLIKLGQTIAQREKRRT